MDPATATLVAGGAGALANIAGVDMMNSANKGMANRQMDFQERMSSTAYQRSMEDMRKAGLNPMLAYMQGGASAPSGASIPAQNVFGGVQDGLDKVASSTRQSTRLKQELINMEKTEAKTEAETKLIAANEEVAKINAKLATQKLKVGQFGEATKGLVGETLLHPQTAAASLVDAIGKKLDIPRAYPSTSAKHPSQRFIEEVNSAYENSRLMKRLKSVFRPSIPKGIKPKGKLTKSARKALTGEK